ncbi:MAG: energy transducer TonB [Muribaculaceae bacterium]|nr:energy transducer TonB [Muribaculaceae bacterium]
MAQYVDLTSKEWCDLVFEGKNKEFGAYEMRLETPKRHNKAVLYTIIGLLLVAAGAFGLAKYNEYRAEQQRLLDEARQKEVALDLSADKEEEEKPDETIIEEKKPEIEPEQEIAQQKVTELAIVPDKEVKEEIKSQTELEKTEEVFTAKNVESENTSRDQLENLNKQVKVEVPEPKKEEPKKVEEIFKSVEQPPQYPGGEAALMKYLSSHIQYPAMAQENNVQGRVVVQFVVEKDGHVGEVKVVRSVDKDLDKEAIRVCKTLPKFTPGRQNGQPVRVWYTLPVNFKLQGTN